MPGAPYQSRYTALAVLLRGTVAGAIGTATMDLAQYVRYRKNGGEDGIFAWEFSGGKNWAGAPPRPGRQAADRGSIPDKAAR